MIVKQLMQSDLRLVFDYQTVAEAVVMLAEEHIHGLPVVDRHDRLVGVLSTSDVLEAAAECAEADERNDLFEQTLVSEIMTSRPKTIRPDADAKEAAKQMLALDVHRLFVEVDGDLVGVISQSDIVRAVAIAKI
jgi:CBS domain-containing protein